MKVRKKENEPIPPLYWVVGGVAGVVLVGIVVAIGWQIGGDGTPKEKKQQPETKYDQRDELPPTPISSLIDMPPGWSINEAKMGFRAAWPIPGDSNNLGYTPMSSFAIGYSGTTPNNWSFAKRDESFAWSVTVVDLLKSGTDDNDAVLDRYVDKTRQRMSASEAEKFRSAKLEVGGASAREIVTVSNGERNTTRAMIVNDRLWTWTVLCPDKTPANDGRITRFLNSFKVL